MPAGLSRILLHAMCVIVLFGAWAPAAHPGPPQKACRGRQEKPDHAQTAPEAVPSPSETRHSAPPRKPSRPTPAPCRPAAQPDWTSTIAWFRARAARVGAVYLYDRKSLPLRSMVRKRENFRDQIGSDEESGPVVE